MLQGKYTLAADSFIKCNISVEDSLNNYIDTKDITIYAVICGLTTYTRIELKTKVDAYKSFNLIL